MPETSENRQGIGQLRSAIGQSSDLAAQIERGQASMPLRDHFEELARSLDGAPFTMTLLGLDAASRAAALGWLCGEDYHILSIEVPGAVGLVEVQLAERGYVLVKSGRRQEFDRLEPFLDAVRAADLVRQGDADAWLEPMHLEVAAPRGLQGLKLLMPESPASMAESPTLLARLRSESNFLVVAGPIDHPLEESAAAAIRDLAADAMATWVLTCGPIRPPATWRPAGPPCSAAAASRRCTSGQMPARRRSRNSSGKRDRACAAGSSCASVCAGSRRRWTCSRSGSSRSFASTRPGARR